MNKITTGVKDLDTLLDCIYMGDNVVWEVDAGTSIEHFIKSFVHSTLEGDKDVIYVSFNKSPQSVIRQLSPLSRPEGLTILDCFTAGKGKSDGAFLKYYETSHTYPRVVKEDRPADVAHFTETLNRLQDEARPGARYVFDSLTGIQDLWDDEDGTYKYFTYMCPRLFDLGTVAFWVLEKEAHSRSFKANLRHITQVVLNLTKRNERLFLKAHKLDRRLSREAFRTHEYAVNEKGIYIVQQKKEPLFNFGEKIKAARTKLGMSQKELADQIGLTPSFVSQLENNQISPSLNSFFHICSVLRINPASLMKKSSQKEPSWHIKKDDTLKSLMMKEDGYRIYNVTEDGLGGCKAYLVQVEPLAVIDKHFMYQRGEEFIHVLKGTLSVSMESGRQTLAEGDSAHFMNSFPIQWKNQAKEAAELLFLCRN